MFRRRPTPAFLSLLLVIAVFGVDLMLPLGVAAAVPYTFAVLLALADHRQWVGGAVALLCGVLTLAKMGIVPDRGATELWKVLVNRGLALFAIGMTALLGFLRRRAVQKQREAERQLREQQVRLAHVARLSLLGQVAASIAHELNQPLLAIRLHAEMLTSTIAVGHSVTAEQVEDLRTIAAQAGRAAEIVRGVRRLAERGKPGTAAVRAGEAIRSAAGLLAWQAEQAGVRIRIEPGGDGLVQADPVQVEQVLVNLIQNAIDAATATAPPQRIVTVKTTVDPQYVTFHVCDPGTVPPEPSRLFEPFYTTKEGGLGLGLSISRSIAEAHGGSITQQPGADGTEFRFVLPRSEECHP